MPSVQLFLARDFGRVVHVRRIRRLRGTKISSPHRSDVFIVRCTCAQERRQCSARVKCRQTLTVDMPAKYSFSLFDFAGRAAFQAFWNILLHHVRQPRSLSVTHGNKCNGFARVESNQRTRTEQFCTPLAEQQGTHRGKGHANKGKTEGDRGHDSEPGKVRIKQRHDCRSCVAFVQGEEPKLALLHFPQAVFLNLLDTGFFPKYTHRNEPRTLRAVMAAAGLAR